MLDISAKWSPYRTYACRYLWGWKDKEPKEQVANTKKKTPVSKKSKETNQKIMQNSFTFMR